jgi:hypothetical protein
MIAERENKVYEAVSPYFKPVLLDLTPGNRGLNMDRSKILSLLNDVKNGALSPEDALLKLKNGAF